MSTSREAPDLLAAWPEHLRHVSASSLTMWMRCPEQWRYRYVEGRKEIPGSDLVWGSAHHGALEHNFRQKMTTMRDLPVKEVKDRFAFLLDEKIEQLGGPGEIEWKVTRDYKKKTESVATPAEIRDRGAELVGVYQTVAAPSVLPLAVEREFTVEIDAPVPVVGRVDLEAAIVEPFKPPWRSSEHCRVCDRFIGLDGPLVVERGTCSVCAGDRIIDHKTASQDRLQPDSRFQAWTYMLGRELPVEFHLAVKTKEPQITFHDVALAPRRRTLALVHGCMAEIGWYFASYGTEGPWPTSALRDAWACNYCGFRPHCRWWQDAEWEGALF